MFQIVAKEPNHVCVPLHKTHDGFMANTKKQEESFIINGLVFTPSANKIGLITKLVCLYKFLAYDKYEKTFVHTKPAKSVHMDKCNVFNVAWFDKNHIYKCQFVKHAETEPQVVIYPKCSIAANFTHSWVIWINDIAFAMNLSVNHWHQKDTDGSYMDELQKISNEHHIIIGVIHINESMVYKKPFHFFSICEYIIPENANSSMLMYVGKFYTNETNFYCALS